MREPSADPLLSAAPQGRTRAELLADVGRVSARRSPLPPARRLPPEAAVPPGRVGYDLSAPRLLLHTVIDQDGYETLRTTGVVRGDASRAHPDFAEAYAYMRAECARRLPACRGGPLLWAWARTTRAHLVTTVRETARCRERPQVLLTCRVARERAPLLAADVRPEGPPRRQHLAGLPRAPRDGRCRGRGGDLPASPRGRGPTS